MSCQLNIGSPQDPDAIVGILRANEADLRKRITSAVKAVSHMTDRELGQSRDAVANDVKSFVFEMRQRGELGDGSRRLFLSRLRPENGVLAGYEPSYAIVRAQTDDEPTPGGPRP